MSPFNQFEITIIYKKVVLGLDLLVTNEMLYTSAGLIGLMYIHYLSLYKRLLITSFWESIFIKISKFIEEMVLEQVGNKAVKYFPAIFTIFILILIFNLLGIIPFSFAVTGQIIVTILLSSSFFISFVIIGLRTFGKKFLNIFVPRGVSKNILPLLIIIEILSFIIRPISLSIRLFANILAGHILLFIISNFIFVIYHIMIIYCILPFVALCSFFVLEIGISFLQAYVFAILLCIYLKDSLILH